MISLVLEESGSSVETAVSDGKERSRRTLRAPQPELRDDGGRKLGREA